MITCLFTYQGNENHTQGNLFTHPLLESHTPDFLYYIIFSLSVMGFQSNGLCIITWTHRRFLRMPRSPACIELALVDIGSLLIIVAYTIQEIQGEGGPAEIAQEACKLQMAVMGFLQVTEAGVILLLTAERLFGALNYPMMKKY